MTTLVEEELETQRDTGHSDPDWQKWLAMAVPCIVKGCDAEIEWWGNQHWISRLRGDFAMDGFAGCNYCGRYFTTLDDFFTAVRI
ncbi:hypothetical protein MINTMi27_14870 [Mycobacterium intracellulare]|uniref:hypothetical protein n=1 Tax=Mycobacterium intracellulare TaxID=1767 RepID=UPI0019278CD1|nr:hypothetical protein [Mycobacterium intracellulare]BCP41394.1 hypothetical protein MINTMi27_14870 [Mycobacterium intracellulare]